MTGDHVEPAFVKRESVGIPLPILSPPASLSRKCYHLWIQVHTDHLSLCPGRKLLGHNAGAAADVEHPRSTQ